MKTPEKKTDENVFPSISPQSEAWEKANKLIRKLEQGWLERRERDRIYHHLRKIRKFLSGEITEEQYLRSPGRKWGEKPEMEVNKQEKNG